MSPAVGIKNLRYSYGSRVALDDISLSINAGEIFGLLGPNGGGKTTLFRILSTLLPIQSGSCEIFSFNLADQPDQVRQKIGVVFQHPSLDKRLSVHENLSCQGTLYGLRGNDLQERISSLLNQFSLNDRKNDIVEQLSGGLQRRVEIVKGILHKPQLLLMDEPSTGLDPKARRQLWDYLLTLKKENITIMFTTHLMEEAEQCDRLGIINRGQLVAVGNPKELKAKIGGDIVTLHAEDPESLLAKIKEKWGARGQVIDKTIYIEREKGHEFIPQLVEAFPGQMKSVSVGQPTLEDVFIHMTGEDFGKNE